MCPTGSSTLIKTASTGELEEPIAATPGAITVASTSADVTVSSAVTIHRQHPEEQQVQAMNVRKSVRPLPKKHSPFIKQTYKEQEDDQEKLSK